MPGSDWHNHLKEASSAKDVITVCNQFLMTWTFADLGHLPAACQPKTVMELEDVEPYALQLATPLAKADPAAVPLLHRMSAFFTRAAQRLTQITAAHAQPVVAE